MLKEYKLNIIFKSIFVIIIGSFIFDFLFGYITGVFNSTSSMNGGNHDHGATNSIKGYDYSFGGLMDGMLTILINMLLVLFIILIIAAIIKALIEIWKSLGVSSIKSILILTSIILGLILLLDIFNNLLIYNLNL